MEADGGPSLAVALSPCILAWAVAKSSGDPSCVALLCPILIPTSGQELWSLSLSSEKHCSKAWTAGDAGAVMRWRCLLQQAG